MESFLVIFYVICFAFVILLFASQWKLYQKAGKPGWAAIIPIYNIIVLVEIIGKPPIWILWMLLPFVSIIFSIWSTNLLAKSFGKDEGYTVGMIFLPFIFYPVLAFGNAQYLGPQSAEARRNRDMDSM